jgi:hypothetical protein
VAWAAWAAQVVVLVVSNGMRSTGLTVGDGDYSIDDLLSPRLCCNELMLPGRLFQGEKVLL